MVGGDKLKGGTPSSHFQFGASTKNTPLALGFAGRLVIQFSIRLLFADAVELGVGADEELVAGDGDAGPDLVSAGVTHRGAAQNLATLGIDHIHLTAVIL